MSIYKELVRFRLPSGVLDFFEIRDVKKEGDYLHIYFDEKDNILGFHLVKI